MVYEGVARKGYSSFLIMKITISTGIVEIYQGEVTQDQLHDLIDYIHILVNGPADCQELIEQVCNYVSNMSQMGTVTPEMLKSKSRLLECCVARSLVFARLRKKTRMTYIEIGKVFNRDHATVIHGIKQAWLYYKHVYENIFNEKLN